MAGVAKTADKFEAKTAKGKRPFSPEVATAGNLKDVYGKKRGLNEEEREQGFARGKESKLNREADEASVKADTEAKAAQAAAEAASLDKAHQSQKDALKRKGRRASILTSSQGVVDPLGVPGA